MSHINFEKTMMILLILLFILLNWQCSKFDSLNIVNLSLFQKTLWNHKFNWTANSYELHFHFRLHLLCCSDLKLNQENTNIFSIHNDLTPQNRFPMKKRENALILFSLIAFSFCKGSVLSRWFVCFFLEHVVLSKSLEIFTDDESAAKSIQ